MNKLRSTWTRARATNPAVLAATAVIATGIAVMVVTHSTEPLAFLGGLLDVVRDLPGRLLSLI
jgi:hypothetical protein